MLDPWWLLGAAGCWFAYLFFDALGYHYFLRKQGYGVKLSFALYISLMGFYYSNITPGASGGQPMQIYYMNKKGVPIGIGTSGISMKFIANQLMTVLMASALWLWNASFVDRAARRGALGGGHRLADQLRRRAPDSAGGLSPAAGAAHCRLFHPAGTPYAPGQGPRSGRPAREYRAGQLPCQRPAPEPSPRRSPSAWPLRPERAGADVGSSCLCIAPLGSRAPPGTSC